VVVVAAAGPRVGGSSEHWACWRWPVGLNAADIRLCRWVELGGAFQARPIISPYSQSTSRDAPVYPRNKEATKYRIRKGNDFGRQFVNL